MAQSNTKKRETATKKPAWLKEIYKYQTPDHRKSIQQLIESWVPYIALVYLLFWSRQFPYWVTLLISIPTAFFVIRIFVLMHDCGHGSFFKSRKLNNFIGTLCGLPSLTPYLQWRKFHAVHHATVGDLDRRESLHTFEELDLWTVEEYMEKTWWQRIFYRIYRHPLFLFTIAPIFLFTIVYRFPSAVVWRLKLDREMRSVFITDIGIALFLIAMHFTIGIGEILLIYLPTLTLATSTGVWLFYVQHQFENTYWARSDEWDYIQASLHGSSYYKLPPVLQWLTASIGLHHIHHLASRIPNYNLQKCMDEVPQLQEEVPTFTLWESFKLVSLDIWDEQQKRLISIRELKRTYRPRLSTEGS